MVTINANAKINLTLDILGKRTDGYHEVSMVMQSINKKSTISYIIVNSINSKIFFLLVHECTKSTKGKYLPS